MALPTSLITGVDPECIVSATVTSAGTRLSLPESGISLSVPEGALARGHKEDVFIAVLREDRHRPKLSGVLFSMLTKKCGIVWLLD
jgi:leucine-rich repeat transmembrane protein FLRT